MHSVSRTNQHNNVIGYIHLHVLCSYYWKCQWRNTTSDGYGSCNQCDHCNLQKKEVL